MVDRVDRPDPPPPYRIGETREAMEDRQQQHQRGREEQEERAGSMVAGRAWEKFHGGAIAITPFRLKCATIEHCRFRGALLKSGVPLLVADVSAGGGKSYEGVLLMLARLEDYFRLKQMRRGDEVPPQFWAHAEEIEIGIPRRIAGLPVEHGAAERAGTTGAGGAAPSAWLAGAGIIDPRTGALRWSALILYLFAVTVIALAVIQMTS